MLSPLIDRYVTAFGLQESLNPDLLRCLRAYHVPASRELFTEFHQQQTLYFLVAGQVQVNRYHPNGKLAVLALMSPFSVIGDVELFNHPAAISNVTTLQPSVLLGIERQLVLQYGYNDPVFLRFIITHLTHKLYHTSLLQTSHSLPLPSRLALYLLAQPLRADGSVILPSKADLAALLGTTPRHLNRVVKQWKEKEIIVETKSHWIIPDREQLQALIESP